MSPHRRKLTSILVALCVLQSAVAATDPPLDTVVVTGSREAVRRQIQTFVHSVTRMDGQLIGRWRDAICPMVVGVTDRQAQFVQRRLIEVQDNVRKRKSDLDEPCDPNLFVIITDEADVVLAEWKQRDPGMFRWKSRDDVTRSNGTGPVRTWHNAVEGPADGKPVSADAQLPGTSISGLPQGSLSNSRIVASSAENINAVVVLVDTRAAGKVTLAQTADYVAMVSLSQIDLTAKLVGVQSILTLFAEPRPEVPPAALTEWDFAFLKGLYRTSYSPANQRADISARMVRELAPR